MKRFTIFITLFCIMSIVSFSQLPVRSMSDGEKRIYYSCVADAEHKLLELIQASGNMYNFPSKLFVDLILNDERCFEYDFAKLIEASSKVTMRQLRIKTSCDGKLRLYSWDADGGTMSNYIGITSYKNEYGIQSFASPIEYGSYSDDENLYIEFGYIACGVTDIVTLTKNDGYNVYIVKSHSSGSNILQMTTLSAYTIDHDGLKPYQIFPGAEEYKSSLTYDVDPCQAFGAGIILKDTEIFIPETMESENPYGSPRITGRYKIYKFNGEKYKYHCITYDDILYKKLCNYQYNIIQIYADPYIIRIDKMPDGANRYVSWKNKKVDEQPDLVISNGYVHPLC